MLPGAESHAVAGPAPGHVGGRGRHARRRAATAAGSDSRGHQVRSTSGAPQVVLVLGTLLIAVRDRQPGIHAGSYRHALPGHCWLVAVAGCRRQHGEHRCSCRLRSVPHRWRPRPTLATSPSLLGVYKRWAVRSCCNRLGFRRSRQASAAAVPDPGRNPRGADARTTEFAFPGPPGRYDQRALARPASVAGGADRPAVPAAGGLARAGWITYLRELGYRLTQRLPRRPSGQRVQRQAAADGPCLSQAGDAAMADSSVWPVCPLRRHPRQPGRRSIVRRAAAWG